MTENTHFKKIALAGAVGAMLLVSNLANAHVFYNITGNGIAATGSPSDGSQAAANWKGGDPGYTGNLPATWVAEIHNDGGVEDEQVVSSSYAGFLIGMGARAYKNGTTNSAVTADFGLFELANDAEVTITVASHASNLRPAFGLWSGWDTGSGSRNGSYTNNGAIGQMDDGVLGSTLSLVDLNAWAFALTQGPTASATLTRFLTAGKYTMILGGYDGTVAGDNLTYKATVFAAAASPVPLPAAAWMMLTGLMTFLGLQKRKMVA